MRVLSNMSNSFPEVARCVLARDVHVSGLCISLSAVIAANSPNKRLPVGACWCNFSIQTAKKSQLQPGPNPRPPWAALLTGWPTNMDIEEPNL